MSVCACVVDGGGDRGMVVAERADADAGEQVEVLGVVGVVEVHAFAAREQKRIARVGVEHQLGFSGLQLIQSGVVHATMTSVPELMRVLAKSGRSGGGLGGQDAHALDAVGERFLAGVELGQHAAGDDRGLLECGDLREREPAHDGAVGAFDAGDVGEEDERVGLGGDGGGGGHLVGVDVVVLAVEAERDGGDDGDGAHGPDGVEPLGVGGGDLADEAEVVLGLLLARAEDVAVAAGEADGGDAELRECGDERLVDAAAEDHERGVAGLGVGDAEAGDELGLLAHLREEPGELHAAAVDERDLVAVAREIGDGLCADGEELGLFKGGSAEFDDEFHGRTPRCEKQIPFGNDRKKATKAKRLSQEALLLVEAGHEVHVFDGLRGGAFEQVVEAGDDDEPAMVGREMEAEVAEAGAHDVLDLRQRGRAADADERGVRVEVVEAGLNLVDSARLI